MHCGTATATLQGQLQIQESGYWILENLEYPEERSIQPWRSVTNTSRQQLSSAQLPLSMRTLARGIDAISILLFKSSAWHFYSGRRMTQVHARFDYFDVHDLPLAVSGALVICLV